MLTVLQKIFGSANDRLIRKFQKTVTSINEHEAELSKLSNAELQAYTAKFKERLRKGETLEDILVEAYAVVREASKRVFGLRLFDVQMIGGIALHKGMIAEMRTGEGKTNTATLPVYLNALMDKGVHVVTINDYLAKRDAEWMGKLYNFLGLSVGCIVHGLNDHQRRQAYSSDVTYGTNHEFGFDYLRDNMKFQLSSMVLRPFNYAIVDEVDSILVDEARTPLIISGPAEDSSDFYKKINALIPLLEAQDFEKDEKQKSVTLTESGVERIEELLYREKLIKGSGLYDLYNIVIVHHVNAALKAHKIFAKDVDYIVKNKKVLIIDEFTGRMMEGRRYSDGLHQALEAKEGVEIEEENQTLASITYQNFFRLYPKLSGMTGTALTEAVEFEEIYNLQVLEIPTNVSIQRKDFDDEIYLTANEKYKAVIDLIKECQKRRQPILVGTISIEKSEYLSDLLKKENIPHQVLNARYHEQEAYIVADAGRCGTITIATNMAGRGTDIKLGGNWEMRVERELADISEGLAREELIAKIREEVEQDQARVRESGGLYVIGTERHESRRIDNQLRGRSGRQGDPGASKFFVSLEDDLMRIFGSERLDAMLRRLGVQEGEVISHSWINKALERAQRKVEARNFDVRKHLLKYDDVMNDQRKIIYEQRREIMDTQDISEVIQDIFEEVVYRTIDIHILDSSLPDQWDVDGLHAECLQLIGKEIPLSVWIKEDAISVHEVKRRILEVVKAMYAQKESTYGSDVLRAAEKNVLLRVLDQNWKEHLLTLDHLRQGVNLRAYAQSNPLNEYKREAFNLFHTLLFKVQCETITMLLHFESEGSHTQDQENEEAAALEFNLMDEIPEFMREHMKELEEMVLSEERKKEKKKNSSSLQTKSLNKQEKNKEKTDKK